MKTHKSDEEDNILSNKKTDENGAQSPEKAESPDSLGSPDQMALTAQYSAEQEEQVSIEFEHIEEYTKEQDYSLLNKLFEFLDAPPESEDPTKGLNSTLCGYFGKVVQIMITFEPLEFNKFVQQDDYAILNKMVKHLDNKSIVEMFVKIMNEVLKRSADSLIVSQTGVAGLAQS